MKLARVEFYRKGVQTFPVIKAVAVDADEVCVIFNVNGEPHFDIFTLSTPAHVTVLATEPDAGKYNQIVFTPGSSAGAQPTATASLVTL